MEEMLKQVLEALAPVLGNLGEVKWLGYLLMGMGAMRLLMKPILALAYSIADLTVNTKDNEFLKKMEGNVFFKALLFILDWSASIKLPPKEVK